MDLAFFPFFIAHTLNNPTMATSASHPHPFPSRPYTSGLGRTGGQSAFQPTPYNTQTPFNAPAQNTAGLGTAATTQQQRDAQRLDRERQERAERERREADERGVLESLSEEQREEVNEAVCLSHPKGVADRAWLNTDVRRSSHSSTSTRTTTSITTNSKSRSKPSASTSPNPTSSTSSKPTGSQPHNSQTASNPHPRNRHSADLPAYSSRTPLSSQSPPSASNLEIHEKRSYGPSTCSIWTARVESSLET